MQAETGIGAREGIPDGTDVEILDAAAAVLDKLHSEGFA